MHPDKLTARSRGTGVETRHLLTPEMGAREFVNGITDISPGAAIPLHWHNCDESVVILKGVGLLESPAGLEEVEPFDTTWVPAGVPHRFSNPGDQVLRILWTYGSAAATRTLASTGETVAVGSAAESRLGAEPDATV